MGWGGCLLWLGTRSIGRIDRFNSDSTTPTGSLHLGALPYGACSVLPWAAVRFKHGGQWQRRAESATNYIDKLLFEASTIHRIMRFYSNSLFGSCAIVNISAFATMSTQVRNSYQLSSRSEYPTASREASMQAHPTRPHCPFEKNLPRSPV